MERLTFDGNFCDIAQCRELPCPYDNNCMQKQVWERLKSYEDTRLSPKGLKQAAEIEERLNERGSSISRVAELIKADDERRVLVLPCKVGDTVWFTPDGKRVCECEVLSIYPERYDATIVLGSKFGLKRTTQRHTSSFGKTVFLTREEAEKALEARNGDQ